MITRRSFLRHFLLVSGAVATATASIPGCTAPAATTPPKPVADQTQPPAVPKGTPSQAKITFWALADSRSKQAYEDNVRSFQTANPDVTVDGGYWVAAEFFQKVLVAYPGGIGPDVIVVGYGQLGTVVGNGWIEPIDAVISGMPDADDIVPHALDGSKVDGKRYGLLVANPYPFAYRKDFFREAGLDADKPPKTWDELRDYAIRLTKRQADKVTRAGLDIPDQNGEQAFASMAFTHGLKNLWDEGGIPLYESPEAVETLEFIMALRREAKVTAPSEAVGLTGTAFQRSIAAQSFTPMTAIARLEEGIPGLIGVSIPPANPSTKALSLGSWLSLSKGIPSARADAAVKFYRHLCSAESLWRIYEANNHVPPRKSLMPRYTSATPYNQIVSQVFANSVGWPIFKAFVQSRQIIIDELQAIYLGQKSIKEGLRHAAEETKKLL